MTTLTTDQTLLERLYSAASRGVSAGERRHQRVSFVYGNLPKGSTVTKQQVEKALDEMDKLDGASA